MSPLDVPVLTVFILLLFAGVYSTVYGLPGTLAILLAVAVFAALTGFEIIRPVHLLAIGILAALVEALDTVIGLSSTRRPSITLTGIAASLGGSIAGSLILTPLLYGLGTLLGIFLGGFAGLTIAQKIEQRKLKPAFREPAKGTFLRSASVCVKGTVAMGSTAFVLTRIYS